MRASSQLFELWDVAETLGDGSSVCYTFRAPGRGALEQGSTEG